MTPSQTKSSTPKLSDIARHVVAPKGAVSTGWPAVKAKCAEMGISFRPWQNPVGKLILAKRADGKYAATIGGTGLSIPRQVGKTFLVGAIVFALCLLFPNLTVIWTAHRVRTSEETFGKMQAFAKRRKVRPHVRKIVLGSGEEAILFHNGSRILFGAREGGFGLGFDEVDVLIFDEAQRMTETTLDDMIPATNQSRQPTSALVLFMGTPPRPTDRGEVFTRMRQEALSGDDEDTGWVEFGGDPGFEPTPTPGAMTAADWRQIEKANPSYPKDTPREAILRMRKKLGHGSLKREGYGIWDEIGEGSRLITSAQWSDIGIPTPPEDGAPCFGVAFSLDGTRVSLGAALKRDVPHIELVDATKGLEFDLAGGIGPLAAWLSEPSRVERTALIVMSGRDGSPALFDALRARGVPKKMLHVASTTDYFSACSMFHDAVKSGAGSVTRLDSEGQAALDESVAVSDKKHRGTTGSWGWEATTPDGDETPIEAVSLAYWAAKTTKRRPGSGGVQIL